MKRKIDVSDLGQITHELGALQTSTRLEISIGGQIYTGPVELEVETGVVGLHFDTKMKIKAKAKAKAKK